MTTNLYAHYIHAMYYKIEIRHRNEPQALTIPQILLYCNVILNIGGPAFFQPIRAF